MKAEWKRYKVADLIAERKLFIGDGYRAKNDELSSRGLPFARAGNINCGFQFADADHFPEENVSGIGNKVSEPGDVVFTSKGTVGRFALVRDDTQRFVYSPQLCFWRSVDGSLIEPRFLYFWMYGREFFLQYKGVAGQTDMAEYVSLGDQRRMHITLPKIGDQRAIASVLGSLDDKIELNRRMNETLEALAQSLFKSWFVDATANGLPKGWRKSSIGEEVRVVGGSTPSTGKPEFWEGGIHHWATPKDLSSLASPVLLDTERRVTNAGLDEIGSGLLPKGTVLLSSRAPIGYLVISEVPVAVNQGFIAMVCDKELPNYFVCLWAKQNMGLIEANANGTTFMEISKSNFRPLPVIVPPKPLIENFNRQIEPIHRRIVLNLQESRTLAALRDVLLPKLLSGELRMPQAEQAVSNIIPLFKMPAAKPARKASAEFVEAIVIAQFTRHLCGPKIKLLGRKRYNKFSYLAHRKADDDVKEQFLKKAAGPYSPWAKYEGPEKIALKNGYVKNAKDGDFVGFAPGDKVSEIDRYLHYPICAAVDWVVAKFKFRKNDELELLATVDFAAIDLMENKKPVSLETVRHLIATNKEWAAKLKREIFSDTNIARALTELRSIFTKTYAEVRA